MLLHIAHCVCGGKPVFGKYQVSPVNVLFLNTRRVDAALHGGHLLVCASMPTSLYEARDWLAEACADHDIGLIIIDPFKPEPDLNVNKLPAPVLASVSMTEEQMYYQRCWWGWQVKSHDGVQKWTHVRHNIGPKVKNFFTRLDPPRLTDDVPDKLLARDEREDRLLPNLLDFIRQGENGDRLYSEIVSWWRSRGGRPGQPLTHRLDRLERQGKVEMNHRLMGRRGMPPRVYRAL